MFNRVSFFPHREHKLYYQSTKSQKDPRQATLKSKREQFSTILRQWCDEKNEQ